MRSRSRWSGSRKASASRRSCYPTGPAMRRRSRAGAAWGGDAGDASRMPSVLIVDDEPNIRRMVGALLGAEGYEVRDAATGVAAVDRVAESEPDAILLDLMMPGELDGMTTL